MFTTNRVAQWTNRSRSTIVRLVRKGVIEGERSGNSYVIKGTKEEIIAKVNEASLKGGWQQRRQAKAKAKAKARKVKPGRLQLVLELATLLNGDAETIQRLHRFAALDAETAETLLALAEV